MADITVSNVDKKIVDGDQPVRLCNYTDVYYHQRITPDLAFMEATATSEQASRFQLRAGDILVTKDSETPDDIAASAHVPQDLPGVVCGYHLAIVRPRQGTESRYLAWALASRFSRDQFSAAAAGITRFGLRYEAFKDLRVPVVAGPLQLAIADYLDAETARIDALIEKKRRMIELLEERLWVMRREHFERLARECGVTSLRRMVTCLDGRRVPLNREDRASRQGHYPYWGAGNIVDWIDGYLFDEPLVLLGEDGAPFFDRDRDVAFSVEGRIWVNNHIHVLRPLAHCDPKFLANMLNAVDFGRYISGSTRDKLTQDDMWEIEVPVVDLVVQRLSAARILEDAQAIEAAKSVLERQLSLLAEHRQALITAAVTGQLVIPGAAA